MFGDTVRCSSHYCGKNLTETTQGKAACSGHSLSYQGSHAAGMPLANAEGAHSSKSYILVGQETE